MPLRSVFTKACLLLVGLLLVFRLQADEVHTPKPGSAERKAIVDALRKPVAKSLGMPVIFRIQHLKVHNGWAFLKGQPRTKADKAIDYSKTPLAGDSEEADELLAAILKKEGAVWKVVEHSIFTTDVWWHGINSELGAPIGIFDYQEASGSSPD